MSQVKTEERRRQGGKDEDNEKDGRSEGKVKNYSEDKEMKTGVK